MDIYYALLFSCVLNLVLFTDKAEGKQCGSDFIKTVYRACGVARRAFQPIDRSYMYHALLGDVGDEAGKNNLFLNDVNDDDNNVLDSSPVLEDTQFDEHWSLHKTIETLQRELAERSGGMFGTMNSGGRFKRSILKPEETGGLSKRMPPDYFTKKRTVVEDNPNYDGIQGASTNALVPNKLKLMHSLQDIQNYLKKTGLRSISPFQDQPMVYRDSDKKQGDTEVNSFPERSERGASAVNEIADYCCKFGCDWRTLTGICKK